MRLTQPARVGMAVAAGSPLSVEEFPVRDLLWTLWRDDAGVVALEYLLLATIVGLGLVVGLAAVENALNSELTELANVIMVLDQSYSFAGLAVGPSVSSSGSGGQFNAFAFKSGSAAFDAAYTLGLSRLPATPVNIDVWAMP
jgi:Flp pilus assembly pilin Flp